MAKKKKYQFGDVNRPQAKMQDFSGNLPNKDILGFLLSPKGQGLINQYKNAGYGNIKADDNNVVMSRPTGEYKLPPQVELFNTLAQITTGLANKASDVRSGRREYKEYLQSLQPASYENFDEQGLNNLPVYYQTGGQNWIPHNLHKGRCTPLGNPDCPKGSPQYNLALTFKKHHGFHKAMYGEDTPIIRDAYTCQYGCGDVDHKAIQEIMKSGGWIKGAIKHPGRCAHPGDSNCPEGSPQYNLAMRFKYGDLHKSQYGSQTWSDANQEAKRFALEKGLLIGENAHIGNSIPQYIDSRTGKPNMPTSIPSSNQFVNKFVPSDIGPDDISFNSSLNLAQYIDPQSGDIKYAPASYLQLPRFQKKPQQPQDLLAKFPYGGGPLTSDGAKEILRDGTVHGKPLTPAQKKYFGYIAGGGKPKAKTGIDTDEAAAIVNSGRVKGNATTPKQKKLFKMIQDGTSLQAARAKLKAQFGDEDDTNDTPAIEAEEGEVYQTPTGQLKKISDSAPSHEEGGVDIHDASRVLENTSSMRNDKNSKHLLLSPKVATMLTGTPIKKEVSHAEAMDQAHEHISKNINTVQSKMKKNVKALETNERDKYAQNSLDFNLLNLAGQQHPNDVFDKLFKHQEAVKAVHDIENPKAQYGIDNPNAQRIHDTTGWEYLYNVGDRQYFRRQDGTVTSTAGPKMSNEDWANFLKNETPEHKAERLDRTNPAWKYGYTQPQPMSNQVSHPQLHMADVAVSPQGAPFDVPNDTTGNSMEDTPKQNKFNFLASQPKSRFNQPLNWYDVAGPISGLLEGRIPAKYNGAQLRQIQLQQQNPLPSLQAGQRDYNAAMSFLPQNAQGYANAANLFQRKYDVDNQLLGQYSNVNNQIKNQETEYNANVADRQSLIDQQARGVFEDQRLGSIEAQRLQHRTDWDSLMQTLAQNRALNRNGNLLMKLFPAFDQNAQYNGYRVPFRPPITTPNENDGLPNDTSIVTNTTNTGKKQYFMKTADGKLKPITFR